jgi:hypothetical protein
MTNGYSATIALKKGTGVKRNEVNTIARTLALFPKEFRRMSTVCSQCSRDKESTEATTS